MNNGGTNPGYAGATTTMLMLTSVPSSYDGYKYRVVLTNGDACETTSAAASLNINNVLEAVDDDFSTVVINEGSGGVAGDVTANDLFNGVVVTDTDVTISITDNGGVTGAALDVNGNLTIPATTASGTYTIVYSICEASEGTNCSTAEVMVTVSPSLKVDGFKFANVNVYPNPASSQVYIGIPDIASHKNAKVMIYDTNGRLIKEQNLNTASENVDIHSLEDAVYIFEISSDIGKTVKRVVKRS